MPTEMFYRVGRPHPRVVKACASCPVRAACLADALEHDHDFHHVTRGYRAVSASDRDRIREDHHSLRG